MRNFFLLFCILNFALCNSSCSLPSLEKPECADARGAVKQFYSFHFGNDMRPSGENLKARETFLAPELVKSLEGSSEETTDYFTATDNYPKAFRIGSCSLESKDKAILQVLLFWPDDSKSEQKEIKVEAVNNSGKWLINRAFN